MAVRTKYFIAGLLAPTALAMIGYVTIAAIIRQVDNLVTVGIGDIENDFDYE